MWREKRDTTIPKGARSNWKFGVHASDGGLLY